MFPGTHLETQATTAQVAIVTSHDDFEKLTQWYTALATAFRRLFKVQNSLERYQTDIDCYWYTYDCIVISVSPTINTGFINWTEVFQSCEISKPTS